MITQNSLQSKQASKQAIKQADRKKKKSDKVVVVGKQFANFFLKHPLPIMNLPLRFRNSHKHLNILNRHPAGENLHGILKVRFKDNLAHAVDEGRGGSMQDIQTFAEAACLRLLRLAGSSVQDCVGRGEVCVAEEHEDVPYAELGGEGD